MEATIQERQFTEKLNQDRAKAEIETDDAPVSGPAAISNFMEMGLILGAAMLVDFIDVLDLTGFGAILVRFIDIPTLGALWLWRIFKQGVSPYKKSFTYQMLLTLLIEISPFGIIPTWTTFVIYVWIKEHKASKEMFEKTIKKIKAIKK
ncbi:MAG: hypothetical protein ACOZAL_02155 [Patescibacteria group bacterium]